MEDDLATIALPGDRELVVRAATPDDVDGLFALYEALDADDSCRRFFSWFRPNREFFARLAATRERGGDGIVAVVDGRIVAEAGYELLPDGDGELSMVVDRRWRGWLGPYLLEALRRRAATCGVPNLSADVLSTNTPMVVLLTSHGAACRYEDDWTVLHLLIGTTGTTPTWPARTGRPRVLAEVPGRRWQGGAAAVAAGFDVLVCGGPRGTPSLCPALRGEPCPLVMEADAVVARPADDDVWGSLAAAHQRVHPRIPILIERRDGHDEGKGTVQLIRSVVPQRDR